MQIKFLNRFLRIFIIASGTIFSILHFLPATSSSWPKIWSYLATIALAFFPDILSLIKLKPNDQLVFYYYIFLIPAMLLGIDLDYYRTLPFYDKIVHGASGTLTFVFARELLKNHLKKQPLLRFIFLIGAVALIAVLWECYEFSYDQLFHGHMQQLVSVGVADTMWDLIAALIGGLIGFLFLPNSTATE